jgi:hypothetical protein
MKTRMQTAVRHEDRADDLAWRAADRELAAQIAALFTRCPDLDGFSVQPKVLAEGNPAGEEELFVTAIGIAGRPGQDHYKDIFEDIATTLKGLIEERPETHTLLRGRTFARIFH